ncbi:MAG: S4 domain-containing protein, partial [Terriglobia bacterium]
MGKVCLDKLVVERSLAPTREKAQALILAGQIEVNGRPATKAGTQVASDARLERVDEGGARVPVAA